MTDGRYDILLVDDEASMRRAFSSLLGGEGYDVRAVKGADEALQAYDAVRPDLVVLDVMMPATNGFALCGELRQRPDCPPIIFFTAYDTDANEVRALGLGADDVIAKDADPGVFLARVRRALERIAERAPGAAPARETRVRLGRTTVDLARHDVLEGTRRVAHLTASETRIVELLASERGRYFTTDEIFSALRGTGYIGAPSTVRAHVSNLRAKLGAGGALLVGERLSGYTLLK